MAANLTGIESRRFDRLITVEESTASVNAFHGETLSWATLKQVWANVEWVSGGESQQADKKTATSRAVFTVRYDTELRDKKLRIQHDGMTFDVQNVLEVGRRRFLKIECRLFE